MVSFPKISPNLLLGVGGIIAAVFLVSQVRKAGGDLQKALTDIKLPDITLPSISLPSIPNIFAQQPIITAPLTQPSEGGINPADMPILPTDIDVALSRGEEIIPTGFDPNADITRFVPTGDPFTGREEDRPPVEVIPDIIPAPVNGRDERTQRRLQQPSEVLPPPPPVEVISELPVEQTFGFGGTGFIGGTVRENPIDTLSEVLQFFPELTASQAADFLAETGGTILPSQVELVDPDIKNIIAAGGDIPFGEMERVDTSPQDRLSALESEASKAAQTSCELFGLNCELVDSQMA